MGLRHKELERMILPIISIDEFEPKAGSNEEIIVVAFFAVDELPAYDLDDFIDKSIIEFIDSEVSPNPNEEGQYLIFIEFKRQPNFWMKLYDMVEDIENVTGKQNWKVQPYLVDDLYDLHDPNLQDVVITQSEEYVPRSEFDATVEDYVEDSDLLTFEQNEKHLKFGGAYGSIVVEYIDFGSTDRLVNRLRLNEQHVSLNTSATQTALKSILGKKWDVTTIGNYYFFNKVGSDRTVAVKGV